ncbi:hypothetical protein GCM10007092_05150 [Thermus composti]|uniref:Uncharacterized protein n=1 Tax=Thermus composti TaxID=532059 RepID=A0ABV6Q3G2_9DEIN|nr:hypothetical protein [Thermus composti]GGM94782.1 hypothetical protein GCM10007092_05150 [Thermus composti]
MFHWDDELEGRIRAETAHHRLHQSHLERLLEEAQKEILDLRLRLWNLERENALLRQENKALAVERAIPEGTLAPVKALLEEAWLELVLRGWPRVAELGELIHQLERLLNARTPRRSEREPPPPAP